MKRDREMYIGYFPFMPRRYVKTVRNVTVFITLLVVASAVVIGTFQRRFNNGQFEFGTLSTVSGVLATRPFPMLTTDEGVSIMLVGYGKAGAEGTIEHMENIAGDILDGKRVSLRGTLIYGEGKVLMELTEGEESLIEVSGQTAATLAPEAEMLSPINVRGEIVDPKCYFGVMKPAQGKVHRSCAIRCVSGGIPPVLRVAEPGVGIDFYILEGLEGERVNALLLDHIGDDVALTGKSYTLNNDWSVLRIDPRVLDVK